MSEEQTKLDLSAMAEDELLTLQDQVHALKQENAAKIAACRGQIDTAMARNEMGEYIEPKWFAALNGAARHAGQMDQRLAGDLREIKGALRALRMRQRDAIRAERGVDETNPLALLGKAVSLIEMALDLLREE